MRPCASCSAAMILASTRAGFIAGPPYMPEWRSLDGPVMVNSSPKSPRRRVTMPGVSSPNSPVSQIIATSAVNSSALSRMKGTNEGEPDSSSPSKNRLILPGREPWTAFQARQASIKVISWPLSSDAPRARITGPRSPCSRTGSKGERSHRSSGGALAGVKANGL